MWDLHHAQQLREKLVARQKFGQHFLKDSKWKNRIVEGFHPPACFAEIGPGQGAITRLLAKKFKGFVVFEIDSNMQKFHEEAENYKFILQDFLRWDFCFDAEPVKDFSLIGNLPYESGTKIVLRAVEHYQQISHFVFMLQKEVADRIAANEGSRDFGSLSVLVQSKYDLKVSSKIPPSCFSPPPKVDSAVVYAERKEKIPEVDSKPWEGFLKLAFQQKRKLLLNNLKNRYSKGKIIEAFQILKISEKARAEEIAVPIWFDLFRILNHSED